MTEPINTDRMFNEEFEKKKNDDYPLGPLLNAARNHIPDEGKFRAERISFDIVGLVSKNAMGLIVDAEGKKHTGSHETIETQVRPFMHISNPKVFLEKALTFEKAERDYKRSHISNYWTDRNDIPKLWYNATPYDFEHPEQFLDKQIHQLEDRTFTFLEGSRTPLGSLPSLGEELSVTQGFCHDEFESPQELQFVLGSDIDLDAIPAVRYGIVAPETASVYAIQMPVIKPHQFGEVFTERSVDERIKKGTYSRDVDLWELKEKFKKRRERLGRLSPHLGRNIKTADTEGNETVVGKVPEELVGAPPAVVVSLTAALEMFSEKGIRNVVFPTHYPWREHGKLYKFGDDLVYEGGEKDKKIHDQLLKVVLRVAFEVDGVELTSFGEGDHYLRIKLGEKLSSKRPLLQEVIQNVKKGLSTPPPEK